jgi:amino acid transporter
MTDAEPALKRSLSLTLVTLYGLGNILGAGIYVLIGKVAANAGLYAPLSFLVASILAGLTAFTYAELSSRYPLSAGEAVYMQAGFNLKLLSSTVGLLIILAGIVSAATICRGFVGYFHQFVPLSETLVIVLLVSVLGALAAWGIVESVRVAALLALVGVFGLLLVLWVAAPAGEVIVEALHSMTTSIVLSDWHGIMLGGMLAFYAYIGFEDMVNVAEEVRNPVVNLPRAILIALLVSTLLYMAVALVAITSVPVAELANSDAPLAFIYQRATGNSPTAISIIAMFAVVNGALVQIIMASRVCYGLSRQGWLPAMFSRVNQFTRTPLISTLLVSLSILIMALWLPVETLARGASLLLLMVFSLVNLALWRIKKCTDAAPAGFSVPRWIPAAGFVSSTAFLAYQLLAGIY